MKNFLGLKELRENAETYIKKVGKGESFIVLRRSRPVFKISPPDEDTESLWEPVIDFTKVRKGGVSLHDLLARL